MGRRTKDERREDYLAVGACILAETPVLNDAGPGLALAHVKLADVAERAGVSKGALYHLWPSQEAYWRELLQYLIDTDRLVTPHGTVPLDADEAAARPDATTLREYANTLFDAVKDDPAYFAHVSLYSYLDDELVQRRLDGDFRAAVDTTLPILEEAVAAMGRRPRSATALTDLAVATSALLDGLCLQFRIDPGRTPDVPVDPAERWTLFAAAAEALMFAFTEPGPGHADTDPRSRQLVSSGEPGR